MHFDGFLILTIPLSGLVAICRDGKWHWNPVEYSYGKHRWTNALNAIFWFGWLMPGPSASSGYAVSNSRAYR